MFCVITNNTKIVYILNINFLGIGVAEVITQVLKTKIAQLVQKSRPVIVISTTDITKIDMVTSYSMNESEMGNRGSKSHFEKNSVKEQRVDGSWVSTFFLKCGDTLRCTLVCLKKKFFKLNRKI